MSITIGKRGFNSISEHQKIFHQEVDLRRFKGNLILNETQNDTFNLNKQKNLMKLEGLFPNKPKKVRN